MTRILPAMLALLLCLSLAACGGDSQSTESTNSNKAGIRIADYLGGISNGGLGSVTRNNDNDDTIEPYFTRNGLAINAALDQGAFLMEDGFASYEGFTAFDHRHQAYATASIMDIDLVDPYGCLFFDICV